MLWKKKQALRNLAQTNSHFCWRARAVLWPQAPYFDLQTVPFSTGRLFKYHIRNTTTFRLLLDCTNVVEICPLRHFGIAINVYECIPTWTKLNTPYKCGLGRRLTDINVNIWYLGRHENKHTHEAAVVALVFTLIFCSCQWTKECSKSIVFFIQFLQFTSPSFFMN